MATEECAICGDSVPFATTTHVLVNPKHEDGVADHYVCRPCYDEHLEGLFVALESDADEEGNEGDDDLEVNVVEDKNRAAEPTPVPSEDGEEAFDRDTPR